MHIKSNSQLSDRISNLYSKNILDTALIYLMNEKSFCIYGLPGYKMDIFTQKLLALINKKYPNIEIQSFNHVYNKNIIKIIKKSLDKKFKINEDITIKAPKNEQLLIVINKIYFPNRKLFTFLDKIQKSNPKNVIIFTATDYKLLKNKEKYIKFNIFKNKILVPNINLIGIKSLIKSYNEIYKLNIPIRYSKDILILSGGNYSLIHSICTEIFYKGIKILNYPKQLIKSQPLNSQLSKLANLIPQLNIEEQIEIGLLNNNGTLFSKLLSEFLKYHELKGLKILFPKLTKTDRKILTYFVQNPDQIIDKDQFALILDQLSSISSNWAIYKAVERVRDKIEDRYKIVTIKGKGWKLQTNL